MILLVPFFGDLERHAPLLERWFAAYRAAGLSRDTHPAVLLSDVDVSAYASRFECGDAIVDLAGFADLIRPGQPFDVKGALVCAYLLKWSYPTLVLDADAFVARDPAATLAPFLKSPIAMAIDGGAIMHGRSPRLSAPFAGVRKLCAGVMFFGHGDAGRSRLVAGYRRAYEELLALPALPWSPALPHLVEQYAWSIAHHRRGGAVLPASMNWAPHFVGENPFAVINHHYGVRKWAQKSPAD